MCRTTSFVFTLCIFSVASRARAQDIESLPTVAIGAEPKVAPTLTLSAGPLLTVRSKDAGPATGHIAMQVQWAPGLHVAPFVRVAWPFSSRTTETELGRSRAFSLNLTVGTNVYAGPRTWRVRPFAGAGLGLDWLLSETDSRTVRQDQLSSRFGLVASLVAGLRVGLTPRTGIVAQVEAGHGFYASRPDAAAVALATGNGNLLRAALLFSLDR